MSAQPERAGVCNSLQEAHDLVRTRGYVSESPDIPVGRLLEHVPCSILHPGLCPIVAGESLYQQCLQMTTLFTNKILEAHKHEAVGRFFQFTTEPQLRLVVVLVGHVRLANPKLVVVLRVRRCSQRLILCSRQRTATSPSSL